MGIFRGAGGGAGHGARQLNHQYQQPKRIPSKAPCRRLRRGDGGADALTATISLKSERLGIRVNGIALGVVLSESMATLDYLEAINRKMSAQGSAERRTGQGLERPASQTPPRHHYAGRASFQPGP